MCLKMELYIEDSGNQEIVTVMEFKYGLMEQNMKETGGIIKHMERGSFGMLTVMYSMDNGKKTRLMVTEFILM